ncbi:MAG TPA: hypothetical protein DDY34_16505 [Bacteroidales bacterium]|nr:MAG: hypothetical protein A2035_06220 [Nitrospirae bacterium GWA2_42_11]HAS17588.1 hypothetical protein [Nitrospiraceae bacterium]HBH85383.1 hypothetical protein [Bacteroidales bacterium]
MNRYEVIIYWSKEDDAFIAEVPELPGCAADGATYQEALSNVEVIIKEWIINFFPVDSKISYCYFNLRKANFREKDVLRRII